MKALILAAGIASRLRPLTDSIPKCLLEVAGKSILSRTIENLSANGVKEFVVVTGYLQDMIKNHIDGNFSHLQFEYIFNQKYESTNNIYSLWIARQEVQAREFLLLDSDILFDKKIISLLINADYNNCLALRSNGGIGDEEIKVKVDSGDGSIVEISKDVNVEQAVGESIGIEKFDSEFSAHLFDILDDMIQNKGMVNIFYEAAFQNAIHNGYKIFPVDVGNLFCMELDTIDDFKIANNSSHLLHS
jgi:choline kinase